MERGLGRRPSHAAGAKPERRALRPSPRTDANQSLVSCLTAGVQSNSTHCKEQWNFVVIRVWGRASAGWLYRRKTASTGGAIKRLRPTSRPGKNPAMTIEAQSANFNFANTLICAVGSSARRAVPAAIKTSTFPIALLRARGTDRQFHMPAVGKFEVARNDMSGTALDYKSGAVREPAGETIGSAHHNLLNASLEKATRWKFPAAAAVPTSGGPRYRFL